VDDPHISANRNYGRHDTFTFQPSLANTLDALI